MIIGKKKIIQIINGEQDTNKKLITDIDLDSGSQQNNPAKVDLSLGSKCYLSSDTKEIISISRGGHVSIQPNGIFLYQTYEKVNLPKDIAGKISLKMKHTARGLLMSSQTQIDPGYNNYVFGMLYNLSDDVIDVKFREPLVSIEFFRVEDPGETYKGNMNGTTFEQFASKRITSSLGNLEKKLTEAIKKTEQSNLIFKLATGFVTFILTVISVIVAFGSITPVLDIKQINKDLLAIENDRKKLELQVTDLQSKISILNSKLEQKAVAQPKPKKAENQVSNYTK